MKKAYPIEQWASAALKDRNMIVSGFFIPDRLLEGWTFTHQLHSTAGDAAEIRSLFFKKANTEKEQLIRIDLIEADTHAVLREVAVKELSLNMATELFPAVEGPGIACYAGINQSPAFTFFLRANLAVRIRSVGKDEVPTKPIAEKIDVLLREVPEDRENPLAPRIMLDDGKMPTLSDNMRWTLRADDPAERPVYFKIVADSHDIKLSRKGLQVASSENVTLAIRIYAVNSHGIASVMRVGG